MKRYFFILLAIASFSCKKDEDDPIVPSKAFTNTSDTTTHIPNLMHGKFTCWIDGVYFESMNNSVTISNDTFNFTSTNPQNIPLSKPYRVFSIYMKKGITGLYNYETGNNRMYFTMGERKVGASVNTLFHPQLSDMYISQNSGGKFIATFWGELFGTGSGGDVTYKIQSGKISIDVP